MSTDVRPSDVRLGADGRARCAWVGDDAEYARYHDEEWGFPLHGDRALFEKMSLEGFQAGLSWITILRKRPRFREVFAGFEPEAVAAFGDDDVARLMTDAGIIRNRAKIEATISNARLVLALEPGELDAFMWSFAPASHGRPATLAEVPAMTPEAAAMSKALRKRGFRFVGPTTMYALMQSAGMVDDHVDGCWRSLTRDV
ncbi:DNA-3-methyladenine glycosylase I [Microbacterium sp. M3]|uniref:DNA-3-methyladenine glycosylase I n=1 Tax=Microbacterium arthrosphaerae TaxID=792652 RepID=A0ABU4H2L2_9MICO|nr:MULTISPECIES: DNA-3-methyladenine glycosylase I [Microbacterium]MDW4573573.1 DNA-3-methyladenine glycosylase I [Microbacterium arthrosphaerae]MDW7607428.1 DNA-3-methyladenine glycosylase I [Microbacterium sp. M3]